MTKHTNIYQRDKFALKNLEQMFDAVCIACVCVCVCGINTKFCHKLMLLTWSLACRRAHSLHTSSYVCLLRSVALTIMHFAPFSMSTFVLHLQCVCRQAIVMVACCWLQKALPGSLYWTLCAYNRNCQSEKLLQHFAWFFLLFFYSCCFFSFSKLFFFKYLV